MTTQTAIGNDRTVIGRCRADHSQRLHIEAAVAPRLLACAHVMLWLVCCAREEREREREKEREKESKRERKREKERERERERRREGVCVCVCVCVCLCVCVLVCLDVYDLEARQAF